MYLSRYIKIQQMQITKTIQTAPTNLRYGLINDYVILQTSVTISIAASASLAVGIM